MNSTVFCKKHNEQNAYVSKGRLRCKVCNVEAVTKRRKVIKFKSVFYKGGKCENCGYNKCVDAFDFHHKNPEKKDFSISSKGYTRSWEKIKNELDKCTLLCANCHREVHHKLNSEVS